MSQSRRHCSVPGCEEKRGAMFLFPKESALREKWKIVCKIERPVSDFMKVCHRHFPATDVTLSAGGGHKRLREGCVPSLNMPVMVKRKARRNCVIQGCVRTMSQQVSLHFFPKNPILLKQWAVICQLAQEPSRNTRICSDHFREEDFLYGVDGARNLKSGVRPTRNLPAAKQPVSKSRLWMVTTQSYCAGSRCSSAGGNGDSNSDEDLDSKCSCEREGAVPLTGRVHDILNDVPCLDIDHSALSKVRKLMEEFLAMRTSESSREVSLFSMFSSCSWSASVFPCPAISLTKTRSSILDMCATDHQMKMLTGVTVSELGVLHQLLLNVAPCFIESLPSARDKIVLTLCKMRLNLSFDCLSTIFGEDRTECFNSFGSILHVLALILEPLIHWPSREENLASTPSSFRDYQDTRAVVDSIKIPLEIDHASCLKCLSRVDLHYKGKLTNVRVLMGVSPCGLISFLSKCYGELASDQTMFVESKLVSKLEPSLDAIMVSRAINIQEFCRQNKIKLHQTNNEIKERVGLSRNHGKCLARVHVQRAFQRMSAFKILRNLGCSALPHLDNIVTVAAALTNLASKPQVHKCLSVIERDCGC